MVFQEHKVEMKFVKLSLVALCNNVMNCCDKKYCVSMTHHVLY